MLGVVVWRLAVELRSSLFCSGELLACVLGSVTASLATRPAVSALVSSALASCATSFARASSLPLCSADAK